MRDISVHLTSLASGSFPQGESYIEEGRIELTPPVEAAAARVKPFALI